MSFAQSSKDIELFSQSNQWKNILYFGDDGKSIVRGDHYFISDTGHENATAELLATIKAFKNREKHKNGELYECVFMGRKHLLLKKWPGLIQPGDCKEYNEWRTGIDAGSLYLVFTSAYPNNPASMFGHTFFRFDRASKGKEQATKELLGYSLAYQARTDSSDGPLSYTFKGITGGYNAFLEIKPHYLNVGIYNNAESRDTWEYKLNLTPDEKELFLKHSWELSIAAAFDYYFFDENCSTFLLSQLEVVRHNYQYNSKKTLFVVPQETLKEVVTQFNTNPFQFVASIKRRIERQYLAFSNKQKILFSSGKREIKNLKVISDPLVLDALVDYWKWRNYQAKTRLSKKHKQLMFQTMYQRSELKQTEVPASLIQNPVMKQRPDHGHGISKVALAAGDKYQSFRLRYGFHDFYDTPIGHDDSAYINFLDINLTNYNNQLEKRIEIIDILSLQNFYWHLPALSWRAKLNYREFNNDHKVGSLLAGVGISSKLSDHTFYGLFSFTSYKQQSQSIIRPGINLGFKSLYGETKKGQIYFVSEYFGDAATENNGLTGKFKASLLYYQKEKSLSVFFERSLAHENIGLEYSLYF